MEKGLTLVITGVIVVVLVYQNHKLNRTINALDRLVSVIYEYMDADLQEDVDDAFEEIVDNFDE